MSSNPSAERRHRLSVRGWSLRTRLTVILVGLLAVVCLVVGIGTQLALRGFLIARFDSQLRDAGHMAVRIHRDGPPGPLADRRGGRPLSVPGLPPELVRAEVSATGDSGTVFRVHSGQWQTVADPAVARQLTAVPVDGHATTVQLGDGLGQYRAVAYTEPDTGGAVVTALPLDPINRTLMQVAVVELLIAVAALVVAGAGGALIVRRTLRPLRRVASTAARVAELPLHQGEVALSVRVPATDTDPGTEVGQVGAAINRMLGHVANALSARHASELRVRQFVADASHELRTPLAAIRGYAELTRRGAHQLPDDVVHAIGRVESESARMTTLVEDLLLLARLDSGRPLVHEEVDLSRLVVDAVQDAHVAGPRHNWRLDLPDEPVTVPGDAARLHQVLANLLANARTHTPPGCTVTTGVRASAQRVDLAVTDDGPGIPAELLPEVFERFVRGDGSRSRAAGSTGLGMAIVAAVVAAHHGDVSVRSVPGETRVTVRLPRQQTQPVHSNGTGITQDGR